MFFQNITTVKDQIPKLDFQSEKLGIFCGTNLELFLQLFSKKAQFLQALTQVHMAMELNKRLDEVRHPPPSLHLIPTAIWEK